MNNRKGLPGELERETYKALRPIFLKYLAMKKSHMNRYRIIGIMYEGFREAFGLSDSERGKEK